MKSGKNNSKYPQINNFKNRWLFSVVDLDSHHQRSEPRYTLINPIIYFNYIKLITKSPMKETFTAFTTIK